MEALLYRDALFYLHEPPEGYHMEEPWRLVAAYEALHEWGLAQLMRETPAPPWETVEKRLLEVHDESYVNLVKKLSRRGGGYLDADTYVNEYTYMAGLAVAASALDAAARVAEGVAEAALVLGRPPGHHAGRYGAAMGAPTLGFCIFNATALAAKTLADLGYRVYVLDFDLHHGNGTQEILYGDPRIVHIDLHQDPSTIYPGTGWPWQTGEGEAEGTKLNVVLAPGAGDDAIVEAAEAAVEIAVEMHGKPDVVLVDAGFDAYQGDGLGALYASTNTYRVLARLTKRLSSKAVVVLEGGYSSGLRRALPAYVAELLGAGAWPAEEETRSRGRALEETRENLRRLCRALGHTGC